MGLVVFDVPSKCRFDQMLTTLRFIQKGKTSSELSERTGEHKRHGHFLYQNAQILGFAQKTGKSLYLTSEGRSFLNVSEERRTLLIARAILGSRVISIIIQNEGSFERAQGMTVEEIAQFLLGCTSVSKARMKKLKETTAMRRASSVKAWLNWLVENTPVNLLERESRRILDRHK